MHVRIVVYDEARCRLLSRLVAAENVVVDSAAFGVLQEQGKSPSATDLLLLHIGNGNPEHQSYLVAMAGRYSLCLGFTGDGRVTRVERCSYIRPPDACAPVSIQNVWFAPSSLIWDGSRLRPGFIRLLNELKARHQGVPCGVSIDISDLNISAYLTDPVIPLSAAKHNLAHLFLPIDLDLQTLAEALDTDAPDDSLVRAAFEAIQSSNVRDRLQQAREQIYEGETSVRGVVANSRNGDIATADELLAKTGVSGLLPEKEGALVDAFAQCLSTITAVDLADLSCRNGEWKLEFFHEWFCGLDDALHKLREACEHS